MSEAESGGNSKNGGGEKKDLPDVEDDDDGGGGVGLEEGAKMLSQNCFYCSFLLLLSIAHSYSPLS